MSVRVKRRIMTKRDIVRIVSEEAGVKQSSGMVAVNLILCEIKKELLSGNKVAIHNFGVFKKNTDGNLNHPLDYMRQPITLITILLINKVDYENLFGKYYKS